MSLRSERQVVQNPLVRYATEADWTCLSRDDALRQRRGETGLTLWGTFIQDEAHRTTGKYPALFLVSRLYHIGYNALAVLVMMLPSLASLDPLSGQAFKALSFIRIQFLRCFFVSSFIV